MQCDDFARRAKYRITIQSPSDTTDVFGGRTASWSDIGAFWAILEPLSGREVFAQAATQSRATHKITIRYQSGLKNIKTISDYRVSFDGRFFGFSYIRNLSKDMKTHGTDFQEIYVEENGADING